MTSALSILLVEDNPGDIFLIRQALLEHQIDAELFIAQDGDEFTALLEKLGDSVPRPDVLLLDLNLPRIEGPDLFRRVRGHTLCSDAPLIVVTSSDSAKDRAWTSEFGVSHYFRKPSDFAEFMQLGALIREVTGKSGMSVSTS